MLSINRTTGSPSPQATSMAHIQRRDALLPHIHGAGRPVDRNESNKLPLSPNLPIHGASGKRPA
jgi:hypothetical protein